MDRRLIPITFALLFLCITVYAQNMANNKQWYKNESNTNTNETRELRYEVRGNYERAVTKQKLSSTKLLSDIISNYPVNWITDYISVEITATCNGKTMNAMGKNETLTSEQLNLINTIDLGANLKIRVNYSTRNAITHKNDNNQMNVLMVIVPEVEAEFSGGEQPLQKYIKENVINKIPETSFLNLQDRQATLIFTVSEAGEVTQAKISKTTGNADTDALLIKAINNMPKWKPAQNAKGIKVKQEFAFSLGNSGC